MSNDIKRVTLVYVGSREFKIDNVCMSGTTWFGYGDEKEVEKVNMPKYAKHPDIWLEKSVFEARKNEIPPAFSELEAAGVVVAEEKPESEIDLTAIKSAILSLESGNPEHFSTTNGLPILAAVKNIAGDESISAKQVRAAWNELNTKSE